MSSTPFPSTANSSAPIGHSDSGKTGASTSMTVLFGSLVVFSSLFAALLLLCFFWQYRRAQRRGPPGGAVLEYDEAQGTYRGVPKMWEVWTQSEPSGSQGDLESITPLSADVERAPRINPESTTSSRASNLRRFAFRRPIPPTEVTPPGSVPTSRLRMSFIIAMPCADPPNRRRSVLSQGPSVNGDWGRREYAIGIYHAPYLEESSVQP